MSFDTDTIEPMQTPAILPGNPVTLMTATGTRELKNSVAFKDVPFDRLVRPSLVVVLAHHSISQGPRGRQAKRVEDLLALAYQHRCNDVCRPRRFLLSHYLKSDKTNSTPTEGSVREQLEALLKKKVLSKFPQRLSDDRKKEIVSTWLDRFSNESMEQATCAVCSERLLLTQLSTCTLSDAQLGALRNENLKGLFDIQPGLDRFKGAILNPEGFAPTEDEPNALHICTSCEGHLADGLIPPLALANDNYHGHDNMPPRIKELFRNATSVELSLIARYRVRCTIHKFSAPPNSSPALAQRYMKGNTITFTNECDSLLNILPPSKEVIGETICVMFVGSVYPSPEELKRFTPILARRHVVYELLTWLKANNPFYKDVEISLQNLDALLPDDDAAVPIGISLRHIASEARDAEASTYVPTEAPAEGLETRDVPVASHGVIAQSIEGMSIQEITLRAIKHFKTGGGAYTIPHSKKPVSEYDNPGLFPCMFPHLFPYGIGGMEDSRRRRKISLQAHVKHLLNLSDTRFQMDPSFAFVAMNILQRRKTSQAARFKVGRSAYRRAAELLSSVEASTCQRLIDRSKTNGGYC